MRIYDKDQTQFDKYWQQFIEYYGRHLTPQSNDDSNYAYKTCSDTKKEIYARWNNWLNSCRGGDNLFTVLYDNTQTFTLGALYEVVVSDGDYIGVFVVITPSKKYEWYVSSNSLYGTYLGKVPAHRSMAHLEHNRLTERDIDNEQTLHALTGRGAYCYD